MTNGGGGCEAGEATRRSGRKRRLDRGSGCGTADSRRSRAALEGLFRQFPGSGSFAPSLLAEVPFDRIEAVVGDLKKQHGAILSVEDWHGSLVVRLDRADVPARIALDGQNRIAVLFFSPALPVAAGLADPVGAIVALPGRTAVLVTTDGRTRAEHDADVPLAAGSAFKLAVLRAAALACDDRRLAWDRVVPLDPAWRSLPSGLLQDWPDQTPLTVATLANLMVSLSDNTAADALIHLAGRAGVGALAPRNLPFLTTREAFILKARANQGLREQWVAGGEAERSAVLAAIAGLALPRPEELAPGVTSDVEWFFTARELASLLQETRTLPALGINKGPVGPGPWRMVAYKGGSEPGVLNLSALLVAGDGRQHCVVATWNNTEALDEQRLLGPFRTLVQTLGRER